MALLLVLLSSYYYCCHSAHQMYPENPEVVEGVDGMALISGTVSMTAPDGFLLEIESGSSSKTIEIVVSDAKVKKGDRVDVLGRILKGRMYPERMAIQDRWSYYAICILSALTLPFVGYLFLRSWTFDFKIGRFKKNDA